MLCPLRPWLALAAGLALASLPVVLLLRGAPAGQVVMLLGVWPIAFVWVLVGAIWWLTRWVVDPLGFRVNGVRFRWVDVNRVEFHVNDRRDMHDIEDRLEVVVHFEGGGGSSLVPDGLGQALALARCVPPEKRRIK